MRPSDNRQTNESIRERYNIQDAVMWVKTRKKKWEEHLEQMDEDRLAKICKNGRPIGKILSRRPTKRWVQSSFSSSTKSHIILTLHATVSLISTKRKNIVSVNLILYE